MDLGLTMADFCVKIAVVAAAVVAVFSTIGEQNHDLYTTIMTNGDRVKTVARAI